LFIILSDRSDEWKSLSEADKKEIGLIFEDDGEFWYVDLTVNVCNINLFKYNRSAHPESNCQEEGR